MISLPKKKLACILGRFGYRRDTKCLFVLSTGRVGTVTLTYLLNLSSGINAHHEPEPKLRAETKAAFSQVWDAPIKFAKIFEDTRAPMIGVARIKGQVYAEMSNRLTYLAPAIASLLPNAYFIHLFRHPGEVVRSGMQRGWYDHNPFDAYRIEPQPSDPAFLLWKEWDAFTKSCWLWHAVNDFALKFKDTIDPSRIITVRSEDLFDQATKTYEVFFRFLGVCCPSEEKVASVLSTRFNQSVKGEFPKFEQWHMHQRETLYQIAAKTMQRLGLTS